METRHIVAVQLDERLLNILLRDGATVRMMHGIPRAAALLGIAGDFARQCIVAHFEHPSFPPCAPGALPEQHPISFEIIEHPYARDYDFVPVRYGPDADEVLNMRQWILDRAAEILGTEVTK